MIAMKTQNRSSGVLKVLILTALLCNLVSSQDIKEQAANNLFHAILKLVSDPTSQGGVRIQRMSSASDEESADASTIDQSSSVYRYPVIKITDANYTQFASQHEWIYVKFFTDW